MVDKRTSALLPNLWAAVATVGDRAAAATVERPSCQRRDAQSEAGSAVQPMPSDAAHGPLRISG
jgi:hypothetical protein